MVSSSTASAPDPEGTRACSVVTSSAAAAGGAPPTRPASSRTASRATSAARAPGRGPGRAARGRGARCAQRPGGGTCSAPPVSAPRSGLPVARERRRPGRARRRRRGAGRTAAPGPCSCGNWSTSCTAACALLLVALGEEHRAGGDVTALVGADAGDGQPPPMAALTLAARPLIVVALSTVTGSPDRRGDGAAGAATAVGRQRRQGAVVSGATTASVRGDGRLCVAASCVWGDT